MDMTYTAELKSVSKRQRLIIIASLSATLAGLLFLRHFNPVGSGFYPRCIFHSVTGLYCPGCGMTRALYQLMHGNLSAALAMNPLLFLFLPFMVYAFLSYALVIIRGRGLPGVLLNPNLAKLLFWIVVAFGVLRNIPVSPFNLLAPHNL